MRVPELEQRRRVAVHGAAQTVHGVIKRRVLQLLQEPAPALVRQEAATRGLM